MDIKERLNELEENKKMILKKIKEIDTKKLSKKWYVLYEMGYVVTIVTMVLLYKDNLLLAFLLTIGYGISVPALQAVIDNQKRKKLRREYSSINKEIEALQKEIINQYLTEERLKKNIPITSRKQFKELEEKILTELEPSERDRYLSENESFFMGDETDETNEEWLDELLSGDEKKGYTRKRKR